MFKRWVWLGLVGLFSLWGCQSLQPQPIKIGLAIDLSGSGGVVGEYIRNGVMLAVREINEAGGINGRRLKLIIQDDAGTHQGALAADQSLVSQGVVAILGHSTSSTTLVGHSYLSSQKILEITAYATTSELSGRDDFLFRTCVDTRLYARVIARHLKDRGYHRVVTLLDVGNFAYSLDLYRYLATIFPGTIDFVRYHPAKDRSRYKSLVERILSLRPEVVFLLTDTYTTAFFVQRLRQAGFKGNFLATIWAQSPELKEFGGPATEGLELISFVPSQRKTRAYKALKEKVKRYFHHPLTAWTATGYEMVEVLSQALKACPQAQPDCLKEALLKGTFPTVLGQIHFDPYGDVVRPLYLIKIQNNRFVDLGIIEP